MIVREASQRLLALATRYTTDCEVACEFPLPRKGFTRLYLLTYSGVFTSEAEEAACDNAAWAPLLDRGHKMLQMIRSIGAQQAESSSDSGQALTTRLH